MTASDIKVTCVQTNSHSSKLLLTELRALFCWHLQVLERPRSAVTQLPHLGSGQVLNVAALMHLPCFHFIRRSYRGLHLFLLQVASTLVELALQVQLLQLAKLYKQVMDLVLEPQVNACVTCAVA